MQSVTFNKRFSRPEPAHKDLELSQNLIEEAMARAQKGQRKSAKKFIAKLERADSVHSSPECSPAKNKWADFTNQYVRPQSKTNEVNFNVASDS